MRGPSEDELERLVASVDEAADTLDLVGRAPPRLSSALRALAKEGRLALVAQADASTRAALADRLSDALQQATRWIFEGAEAPLSQRTTLPPEQGQSPDELWRGLEAERPDGFREVPAQTELRPTRRSARRVRSG